MSTDQAYLEQAIGQVTDMLRKKRAVWTYGAPAFENFDIAEAFNIHPLQFALAMCNLKLQRLKSRLNEKVLQGVPSPIQSFADDPDAEDSLVDLAAYALLGLGLLHRERARMGEDAAARRRMAQSFPSSDDQSLQIYIEKYLDSEEGRAEVASLAKEMMGEPVVYGICPTCSGPLSCHPEKCPETTAQAVARPVGKHVHQILDAYLQAAGEPIGAGQAPRSERNCL